MRKYIIVLGHRGYRAKYPENTLLSFQKAFEFGADGIEFDIQKTRDGKFAVFHDFSLKRILNIDKNVDEVTIDELQYAEIALGEKVPELVQAVKTFPKGKIINVELKYETLHIDDLPDVFQILTENIEISDLLVSSFSHEFLPYFKERGVRIGMLLGKSDFEKGIFNLVKKIINLNPEFINTSINTYKYVNKYLVNFIFRILQITGHRLAFYTVNLPEQLELVQNIADLIFTDDVETALHLTRGINK